MLFVKLTRAPPRPIQAVVVHAGGDLDLAVEAGTPLSFDAATWDVFQEVTLRARRDPDAVEGTAEIRIHGDAPEIADLVITAVEQEAGLALAIEGASWPGVDYAEKYWNGVVPLHLYAQEGCIERYSGEAPLDYRGPDFWTMPSGGLPCHWYRVGSLRAEAGATKDCDEPPVVLGGAKLFIDETTIIECGSSVATSTKEGVFASFAVELRPENDYVWKHVGRVGGAIEEYYRFELLLPAQP
jgi:hypothetical protein